MLRDTFPLQLIRFSELSAAQKKHSLHMKIPSLSCWSYSRWMIRAKLLKANERHNQLLNVLKKWTDAFQTYLPNLCFKSFCSFFKPVTLSFYIKKLQSDIITVCFNLVELCFPSFCLFIGPMVAFQKVFFLFFLKFKFGFYFWNLGTVYTFTWWTNHTYSIVDVAMLLGCSKNNKNWKFYQQNVLQHFKD